MVFSSSEGGALLTLEHVSDGVIILNFIENEISLRFANTSFRRMLGLAESDKNQQEFYLHSIFASDRVYTEFIEAVVDCVKTGKNRNDMKVQLSNQSVVWVSVFPHPYEVLAEQRLISCIFRPYFLKDTERLNYLNIFNKYSDVRAAIFEYDAALEDTVHLFGSHKTEEALGWDGSESGKYLVRDGLLPKEVIYGFIDGAKKIGKSDVEHLVQGRSMLPHRDENGNVVHEKHDFVSKMTYVGTGPSGLPRYFQVITDTTHINEMELQLLEKKRILEELEYRCSVLKRFFDCAPVFMGMIKAINKKEGEESFEDMQHTFVNPESAKFFKLSTEEVLNRPYSALGIGLPSRKIWAEKFLQAKRTGTPSRFEKMLDNSRCYASFAASHVVDDEYIYVGQDITDRKKLEEELTQSKEQLETTVQARTIQLQQALQVKSRFLAVMSHEMRTPLSGITAAITLLSEASNLSPDQKELLNISRVCSDQLLVAVTDILDLAQMDEGRLSLDSIPFYLQDIMEESLEVVSIEAERKGLELICNVPENQIQAPFLGDPRRLRQIFINLMANSVKFSSKGEIILSAKIQTTSPNGHTEILFSVQDSGIGIPESAKSKLFQPFYQADSTPTRKYGGSGLGLSISKRLAEMMNGTMWFESQEGVGTTFYFTAQIASNGSPAIPRQLSPVNPLEHIRILQIYSHTEGAEILSSYINSMLGIRPQVVFHSEAAKIIFEEQSHHDAIILNLNDKEIADFEIAKQIIAAKLDCPLVVLCYSDLLRKMKESSPSSNRLVLLKKPIKRRSLQKAFAEIFPQCIRKDSRQKFVNEDASLAVLKRNALRDSEVQSILQEKSPEKISVLVAEDNMINQRVLKRLLENIGLRNIDFADDGIKAIEACAKRKYDLVLMDIMMPRMNGIEATIEIFKGSRELQPTHIVALTANALQENKEKCLECGMVGVLTKPLQKSELVAEIQELFGVICK